MVSKEQIEFFAENGHVYVQNLLGAEEVNEYRKEIEEYSQEFAKSQKPLENRDTYGKAFLQMMNLWEENAIIKKMVFDKNLAQVAADLLGVEKVRLYHDQALFKEPGGGPTPWHQDQYYWPLDTNNTITMWMPLVDIDDQMGMLTFASKSQNEVLPLMKISDDSEKFIDNYVNEKGFQIYAQKTMKAGDATFHKGWTLHKAEGNRSDRMRSVMTIIFMDANAKVIEPKNENQEADRLRWLDGFAPGRLAESRLNPVLN